LLKRKVKFRAILPWPSDLSGSIKTCNNTGKVPFGIFGAKISRGIYFNWAAQPQRLGLCPAGRTESGQNNSAYAVKCFTACRLKNRTTSLPENYSK